MGDFFLIYKQKGDFFLIYKQNGDLSISKKVPKRVLNRTLKIVFLKNEKSPFFLLIGIYLPLFPFVCHSQKNPPQNLEEEGYKDNLIYKSK